MGAKQTKLDGNFLPNSSATSYPPLKTENANAVDDKLDPRSPNGCRTPISVS